MKSISAKLLSGVGLGFILLLVGAMLVVKSIQNIAVELDDLIHEELVARQQVNLVLDNFKTQVQEWKNVLIRGHDNEQRTKYWQRFAKKEAEIQDNVTKLVRSPYLPTDFVDKLKLFQQTHLILGEQYRVGMQVFENANYDTQAGDRAVQGIDREASKLLLSLSGNINALVNTRSSYLTDKKDRYIFLSILSLLILAGVTLGLMTRFIQQLITKPIEQASGFSQKIAQGNLDNEIEGYEGDEIGRLLANLGEMQSNLHAMTSDLQQQALENGRIKYALDNVAAPVLLCDAEQVVIYANQQCQHLLNVYQNELNVPNCVLHQPLVPALATKHNTHQEQQSEWEWVESGVVLNVVASPVADEQGKCLGTVYEFSDLTQMRSAEEQVKSIIDSAVQGQLSARLCVDGYSGFMMTLAIGINQMLDAVVLPIRQTKEYLNQIAKGKVPTKIEGAYNGELAEIKLALETSTKAINRLIEDTNLIVTSAKRGHLSTRADTAAHEGDFQKIVAGLNLTLEALSTPIELTSVYLDQIAKGQLPDEISNAYQGDLVNIKSSLVSCIETIKTMLNDTSMLAEAASYGDLHQRANLEKHQGVYADIVSAINQTLDAIEQPLEECIYVMNGLAQGNLTRQVEHDYEGEFAKLKSAVNSSVKQLEQMVIQLLNMSDIIKDSAHHIYDEIADLSERSASQAASVEETTVSMGEITDTVNSNSATAQSASSLAQDISKQAEQGGRLINETVSAMQAISDSSREISNVIEVIDSMAFQTNLLALNASVEAARAGEKGRGFAVVAAEVRDLSQRSASASKDIASLLKESADKVEQGMSLVTQSGQTLTEIVGNIKILASKMGDIAQASSEQSSGVAQINIAVQQLDGSIQKNNSLVENTTTASVFLMDKANELKQLMAVFEAESDAVDDSSTALQVVN